MRSISRWQSYVNWIQYMPITYICNLYFMWQKCEQNPPNFLRITRIIGIVIPYIGVTEREDYIIWHSVSKLNRDLREEIPVWKGVSPLMTRHTPLQVISNLFKEKWLYWWFLRRSRCEASGRGSCAFCPVPKLFIKRNKQFSLYDGAKKVVELAMGLKNKGQQRRKKLWN